MMRQVVLPSLSFVLSRFRTGSFKLFFFLPIFLLFSRLGPLIESSPVRRGPVPLPSFYRVFTEFSFRSLFGCHFWLSSFLLRSSIGRSTNVASFSWIFIAKKKQTKQTNETEFCKWNSVRSLGIETDRWLVDQAPWLVETWQARSCCCCCCCRCCPSASTVRLHLPSFHWPPRIAPRIAVPVASRWFHLIYVTVTEFLLGFAIVTKLLHTCLLSVKLV